jgi:DNA mismatch endonuclease, patch repair protein
MARQLPLSPKATSLNISNVMKANKAKDTKPELMLRKFLWENGFRGYRLNWKKIPGRPDVCYPKRKLAIFVNGCFWHRCPICSLTLPKSNTEFWKKKFELNVIRDATKKEALEEHGWKVLVLWECELKNKDLGHILEFFK